MKQLFLHSFFFLFLVLLNKSALSQKQTWWHGIQREIHYKPDGEDFLLMNGSRRFNRALYGGNTAFRVEAGDLPEFALYLPGMGGNLKFGLIKNNQSKWLINGNKIETRYRAGSMIYKINAPYFLRDTGETGRFHDCNINIKNYLRVSEPSETGGETAVKQWSNERAAAPAAKFNVGWKGA
jgi:hypothetical protein